MNTLNPGQSLPVDSPVFTLNNQSSQIAVLLIAAQTITFTQVLPPGSIVAFTLNNQGPGTVLTNIGAVPVGVSQQ